MARREPAAQATGDGRADRGREGERVAAAFLEASGFRVLARNHRTRQGEVDLVCQEKDELVFVEVRSRSSEEQGGPEETVDVRKGRRVVAAATDWALANGGLERFIRFDVVAVTFGEGEPRIAHFRAAFDATGRRGIW